jgi:ATP-dependent DNA helicase DinG
VKGENLRLPAGRIEVRSGLRAMRCRAWPPRLPNSNRHLDSQAERGEGLANCLRRSQELAAALKRWRGIGADPQRAAGEDSAMRS